MINSFSMAVADWLGSLTNDWPRILTPLLFLVAVIFFVLSFFEYWFAWLVLPKRTFARIYWGEP